MAALWLCLLLWSMQTFALMVGTYSTPPFSMSEDGEDIGLATEAVRNLLHKSGIQDYKIISYPLARGLHELRSGRIDIYYPYVAEIEAYEDDFVLIGPISKYRVALFVRRDYRNEVSLTAMSKLVLGAERGSIGDMVLQKNHIHIEKATKEISCLTMVLAERISACAMGTLPGTYVAAINNIYDELRYVETGEYANMYVALRSDLPAELIQKIQEAFTKLKQENYFEAQQLDYEKKFQLFIKSLKTGKPPV